MDTVAVDGVTVNLDPNVRYYALHKPPGVVTTMHDPQGRPDIRGFLPEDGPRVFPVGASIATAKGSCSSRTTGSSATGCSIRATRSRRSTWPRWRARRPTVRSPGSGEAWSSRTASRSRTAVRVVAASGPRGALRLTMTEGRKREVRRLLAEVGLPVTRLVRLRIGPVKLGNLPPGELRELTPEEIRSLARATDM